MKQGGELTMVTDPFHALECSSATATSSTSGHLDPRWRRTRSHTCSWKSERQKKFLLPHHRLQREWHGVHLLKTWIVDGIPGWLDYHYKFSKVISKKYPTIDNWLQIIGLLTFAALCQKSHPGIFSLHPFVLGTGWNRPTLMVQLSPSNSSQWPKPLKNKVWSQPSVLLAWTFLGCRAYPLFWTIANHYSIYSNHQPYLWWPKSSM